MSAVSSTASEFSAMAAFLARVVVVEIGIGTDLRFGTTVTLTIFVAVVQALAFFSAPHLAWISRHGGRGGIRTHGRLSPTAVFKTAALNHSATRPWSCS